MVIWLECNGRSYAREGGAVKQDGFYNRSIGKTKLINLLSVQDRDNYKTILLKALHARGCLLPASTHVYENLSTYR